jgi:hypothetical protein
VYSWNTILHNGHFVQPNSPLIKMIIVYVHDHYQERVFTINILLEHTYTMMLQWKIIYLWCYLPCPCTNNLSLNSPKPDSLILMNREPIALGLEKLSRLSHKESILSLHLTSWRPCWINLNKRISLTVIVSEVCFPPTFSCKS